MDQSVWCPYMSRVLKIIRKENKRANDLEKSIKGSKIKENGKSKNLKRAKGQIKIKARERKGHKP